MSSLGDAWVTVRALAGAEVRWGGGPVEVQQAGASAGMSWTTRRDAWVLVVVTSMGELSCLATREDETPVAVLADRSASGLTRADIDRMAIQAGYRRHLGVLDVVDYGSLDEEAGWIVVPLERVPASVLSQYPGSWLAEVRDLHMDMTREAGRRADAHLARYAFASRRLPARGRILDAGCGLGYGARLLARQEGRSVLGIDIDPSSIDYASVDAEQVPRVTFRVGDIGSLADIPDGSVDGVVSFDTLERVPDVEACLRELRRVMSDQGPIVVSVPYRWIRDDSDSRAYHVDWYDARKLVELISRYFVVDALWAQTAGGGRVCGDVPRAWRRVPAIGVEPEPPTEWLIIEGRRAALRPRTSSRDWVCLAPGVPQLATMLAVMRERQIAPGDVTVWGCSAVVDDAFHVAMREAAEAFGASYAGNLFTTVDLPAMGDPLDWAPDDSTDRETFGARVRDRYPVLESLAGCRLMMPVRPEVPADYGLVAAASPSELVLVADGIQNQTIVRDFTGVRRFEDNALARVPLRAAVTCPPWLASEAAAIGDARPLHEDVCRDVLRAIGRIDAASDLVRELGDANAPFGAVLLSQHFALSGLTSPEAETVFYVHQVRRLLTSTPHRVLVKAHPRDPHDKLARLERAFAAEGSRVRITRGAENHVPIEAFPQLAGGTPLLVWGVSSTALLGVRDWPGASVACVEADYLEGEIRRQAIQFATRHAISRVALSFDDVDLAPDERAALRRRLKVAGPGPALGTTLARRLGTPGEPTELAAERARLRCAMERLEGTQQTLDVMRERACRRLLAWLDSETRPVVVWGAGEGGRRVIEALRVPVVAVVDSNARKEGATCAGRPVMLPAVLEGGPLRSAVVLVASQHAAAIAETLRAMGRAEDEDYVVLDYDDLVWLEGTSSKSRATIDA